MSNIYIFKIPQDPIERCVKITSKVFEDFYREYFSVNTMKAVVYTGFELDSNNKVTDNLVYLIRLYTNINCTVYKDYVIYKGVIFEQSKSKPTKEVSRIPKDIRGLVKELGISLSGVFK